MTKVVNRFIVALVVNIAEFKALDMTTAQMEALLNSYVSLVHATVSKV